ncbi:MAG: biopolymer transporter ExbD [Oleiphilaceae bacterium]|nr:biopolymer transporter ExbD [Oleiphilaceae bacterium]
MPELTPPTPGSGKTLMERVEDSLLPLINLVFLLLMFFLMVGQVTETTLPQLPGMAGKDRPEPPRPDLVVEASGTWVADGQTLTADTLAKALPKPQDKPLRVAADQTVTMTELETLFQQLEELGHTDILLLTEPVP